MMWEPSQAIVDQVIAHAKEVMPRECCGLVRGESFIPIHNISPDNGSFLMEPRAFLNAMKQGPVDAVAHSHVFLPPTASELDLSSCEASALPWLIVSIPAETHTVIRPSGFKAPLVGRSWGWGVHDCFAIIRDGYSAYAGIDLPDIHRDWEFWKDPHDFIRASMPQMGFVELKPTATWRHLDVIGIKIHGKVVNHLALYLEPGNMLHQMSQRFSEKVVYGGMWRDQTELHARHVDMVALYGET